MTDQKKRGFRKERIEAQVQESLGDILKEFTGELPGLLTITRVDVSSDLKWAKVWFSVVQGDAKRHQKTLEKNIYDIQGALNQKLHMKVFPKVSFHFDSTPEYVQHMDEIFNSLSTTSDSH